MKSSLEEDFMARQFGPQYIAYKRAVKALIQFIC
jgi:protein-S-isoprenylcysteine O-methyltransferase Ste14